MTETFGLTATQRDAMRIIQELMDDAGGMVSPSYEEIAREMGLRNKGGVSRLVDLLCERGYLRRRQRQARSLEILKRVPVAEDVEFVGTFEAPGLAAMFGTANG